jgi:hypothetical protein
MGEFLMRGLLIVALSLAAVAVGAGETVGNWNPDDYATLYEEKVEWVPDLSRPYDYDSALYVSRWVPADRTPDSERYSVYTVLTPVTQEFTVGKPMVFRIELVNDSDNTVWYDAQELGHGAMRIVDAAGKICTYTQASGQTCGSYVPLPPGGRVVLQETDVCEDYAILSEGGYEVQVACGMSIAQQDPFANWNPIANRSNNRSTSERELRAISIWERLDRNPIYRFFSHLKYNRRPPEEYPAYFQSSNIVKINVGAGEVSAKDALFTTLSPLALARRAWFSSSDFDAYVCLRMCPPREESTTIACTYILVFSGEVLVPEHYGTAYEILCETPWGTAVLMDNEIAREAWPSIREDIVRALSIE